MIRIAYFLFIFSFIYAQESKPIIEVSSSVDTALITIGDRIKYTIDIDHRSGMRVLQPGAGVNLGQFEIKDYKIHEPVTEDDRVHLKYEYWISVFDTGRFVIPPFPVAYFPSDTTKDYKIIEASAINIYVESVITDENKELRDVKSPVYIPFDYLAFSLIVIGSLILAAIIFFGYKFYKKRKESGYLFKPPEPPIPAHEIAFEALDALIAKDLPGQGEFKQYYTELSDIIRIYIEGRFFIKALEETSYEILRDIKRQEISNENYAGLKELLDLSDLVKFAKYKPDENENTNSESLARQFITGTMIIMQQAEETEPDNTELVPAVDDKK